MVWTVRGELQLVLGISQILHLPTVNLMPTDAIIAPCGILFR
jgi:hypothetical protein